MSRKRYMTDIDHAARRAWGRSVALVCGLIVVLNLVGGLAAGFSSRGASPMLADLAGDRIVICTGAGMIVVDRDGKPVEPEKGGAPELCPYCLPLMQGSADAPALIAFIVPPVVGRPVETAPHDFTRPKPSRLGVVAQPRGPPAA